ncbi:unnamed protein product [Oikopleura dioica]|uniref:Uncharacterized protein n=1 Tax=Oikopleura dioica TaxID=34765 RepID=E4YVR5_OIKDI|nr:unnamed protein product [Oikopleura dioica]
MSLKKPASRLKRFKSRTFDCFRSSATRTRSISICIKSVSRLETCSKYKRRKRKFLKAKYCSSKLKLKASRSSSASSKKRKCFKLHKLRMENRNFLFVPRTSHTF